jgi:O-antigen ligase
MPVRSIPTSSSRSQERRAFVALLILVAGCFAGILLGGGCESGSLGIFLLIAGLVLVAFRSSQKVGWPLWIASTAAVASSALALLPQNWFPTPSWRSAWEASPAIPVGPAVSVQPEETMFWIALLALSISVILFVFSQPLRSRHLTILAGCVLAAITGYAALAIYSALTGWIFPFDTDATFGFFPNRNHTAALLVIGSLLSLGLLGLSRERQSHLRRVLGGLGLGLCTTALMFFSISRAGLVYLAIGFVIWILGCRHFALRAKNLLILGAAFLYLLAGFLVTETAAQQRLLALVGLGQSGSQVNPSRALNSGPRGVGDFRQPIFADTVRLIRDFPMTGVGLGNFAAVFPQYCDQSLTEATVLHPESDWLMLIAETGLPGLVCFGILILVAARQAFSRRDHPIWPLRWGMITAVLVAILHGMVDVPIHRPQLGLFIFILAGLALAPRRPHEPAGPFEQVFFPVAGLGCAALGILLIRAEWFGAPPLPPFAAEHAGTEIYNLVEARRFEEAVAVADQAIERSPSADGLYFQLGVLLLNFTDTAEETDELFAAQRQINPNLPEISADQGRIWLGKNLENTAALWADAVRRQQRIDARTGRAEAMAAYRRLSDEARHVPGLRRSIYERLRLAEDATSSSGEADRLELDLSFLESGDRADWEAVGQTLLAEDPDLKRLAPPQKARFVRVWSRIGNQDLLSAAFREHPEWEPACWPEMAEASARQKDFEAACQLLFRYVAPPILPKLPAKSLAEAEQTSSRNPNDVAALCQLQLAQREAKAWPDAARTAERLSTLSEPPLYAFYLLAEAEARSGRWERAWIALQEFRRRVPAAALAR